MIGLTSSEGAQNGGKPPKRGLRPRAIGRTKGGLNSRLHVVSDGRWRALTLFLSSKQMSDARGALVLLAQVLLAQLPPAKRLLGDKGQDADRRRDGLTAPNKNRLIWLRQMRAQPRVTKASWMSARRSSRMARRRKRASQAKVRSTAQRRRPSFSLVSTPRLAMRGWTERARHSARQRR